MWPSKVGGFVHLIPNHALEAEMAKSIGVKDAQALFSEIPKALKIHGLKLPPAEPERHLVRRLRTALGKNRDYESFPTFLGGGLKPQLVPAAVKAVAHRQEFITSYTPYQPEVSQGLLQVIFEYQSLMCDITRMDVSNAGLYDHPTALGEAALMATRSTNRMTFLVPKALSWEKLSILQNYTVGPGIKVESYGFDDRTGKADLADLKSKLGPDVAGVYLENPNHFGVFEEEAKQVGDLAHAAGALFVMGVDLTSLGVVAPPGTLGADVVVAEGSCFGGAPALGGPLLGVMCAKEEHVRKMPGRIIGATRDESGKRGFVMTLQAREQHIRRTKATSNICSNEALIANQAAIHLTMLGRTGLRTMGLQNLAAGKRLQDLLGKAGLRPRFTGAIYNEIVTDVPGGPAVLHEKLLAAGVHGGAQVGSDVASLKACMLWGATPVQSDSDFAALAKALGVSA